jgi:hypothetical protein
VKIVKNEMDPPLFTGKLLFDDFHFCRSRVIGLDMTENRFFYPMSYDNLNSVSQNVLKFYQQLTGEERRLSLSFLTIKSNNSGTAKVKIVKNEMDPPLFTGKLLIKFQNILRNTTQVIIRHRVKIIHVI